MLVMRVRARTLYAHTCASMSAGVYVRGFGQPHAQELARTHTCTCIRYERMETLHMCDPCVVGSQAFESASAFNANIGAWNTARATTLSYVSAFRPSRLTQRSRALGRAINVHKSRLR
jgi:hypothetical protein